MLKEKDITPSRAERICKGKFGHYTQRAAQNAANYHEKHLGIKMNVYLCPVCKHWHTGHKSEWVASQSSLSKTIVAACRQLGADVV